MRLAGWRPAWTRIMGGEGAQEKQPMTGQSWLRGSCLETAVNQVKQWLQNCCVLLGWPEPKWEEQLGNPLLLCWAWRGAAAMPGDDSGGPGLPRKDQSAAGEMAAALRPRNLPGVQRASSECRWSGSLESASVGAMHWCECSPRRTMILVVMMDSVLNGLF